jgi:hypothetical protein
MYLDVLFRPVSDSRATAHSRPNPGTDGHSRPASPHPAPYCCSDTGTYSRPAYPHAAPDSGLTPKSGVLHKRFDWQ